MSTSPGKRYSLNNSFKVLCYMKSSQEVSQRLHIIIYQNYQMIIYQIGHSENELNHFHLPYSIYWCASGIDHRTHIFLFLC